MINNNMNKMNSLIEEEIYVEIQKKKQRLS